MAHKAGVKADIISNEILAGCRSADALRSNHGAQVRVRLQSGFRDKAELGDNEVET